jgi:hypothetical protein
VKLGHRQTNAPPQARGIATTDCAKAPTRRGLRPGATSRDPPAGPKACRREAYFFFRVVRFLAAFLEARFLAAFLGARFFEARFLVAFLLARFFVERFFVERFLAAFFVERFFAARFFVERFFVERFLAAFLVVRFFAARFLAGRLFFAAFLVRFFAVAISTSSKVGQDCRCTYRIVTSLHVSSGTAHELYISLLHLSEKFCNLGT